MSRHNKTKDDIRITYGYRRALPIQVLNKLDDMREVCAYWHNQPELRGCLTLDRERFQVLEEAMIGARISVDGIKAAIDTYVEFVRTDDWHVRELKAGHDVTKKFHNFMKPSCLEEWIEKYTANLIAAKTAERRNQTIDDQRRRDRYEQTRIQAHRQQVRTWFDGLSIERRQQLIDDATATITMPGVRRQAQQAGINSLLVLTEIGKVMEAERTNAQTAMTNAGSR